jgi:hypothetical protein
MGVNGDRTTVHLYTPPFSSTHILKLLIQLSTFFGGPQPGFSTVFRSYARNDGDTVFTRPFHAKNPEKSNKKSIF